LESGALFRLPHWGQTMMTLLSKTQLHSDSCLPIPGQQVWALALII
jgi:hypothetical protein